MKKETLYNLQKIWRQGGIADLLLEGESGRRDIYLTTLALRNQLLELIETQFPANVSLLFRQTQWTKYFYCEQDTDIVVSLKIIFNLLYQIHLANALDKGPSRHFHWPFHEIVELNRHKSLLINFLPESISKELFGFLSYYWPNSDKMVCGDEEEKIEKNWLLVSEQLPENHLSSEEKNPSQKDLMVVYENEEDSESRWLIAPLILKEDYIASHLTNLLHTEGSVDRIMRLIDIYRKRLWEKKALEKSLIISELAKFIRECFFYLDYMEARLGAPGMFSKPLTETLLSYLEGDAAETLAAFKKHLFIEKGQFFVKERLEKVKERQAEIEKILKDSEVKGNVPVNIHKNNGLRKAHSHLEELKTDLTAGPSQDFNLKEVYQYCIAAVDELINLLKEQFPQAYKEIIYSLNNLRGNLNEMFISESPQEEIEEYLRFKSGYLRLTLQIPKTCGVYLQKQIQTLDQKFQYSLTNSSELAKVYKKAWKRDQKQRQVALDSTLELIQTEVGVLLEEIQKPKTVSWWWPIVPTYPMRDEVKADYCDNLLCLKDALLAYVKTPTSDTMKRIAVLIFDLRRLERNRGELNRNPAFKKIWININEQIEVLKQRDISFNRAILSHEPVAIIENPEWCESMKLEKPLPPLPAPTEKQILKTLNEMISKMHTQIMQVVNNQSKDSKYSRELGCAVDGFYYQRLRQNTWQEYSFDEDETTETYTIKLLLNILYKIRHATREGIDTKGWYTRVLSKQKSEWLKRLTELPVFDISRLISELPVFFANNGLENLGAEIISTVNMIKSLVKGDKQEEFIKIARVTLDMNTQTTATPLNAVVHSGLVGTDLPQLMLLLSNGEKYYSKTKGKVKVASQIVKPNWKNFRDEKAVIETGKLLLNSLVKLDNLAAKTSLNENKILVNRLTKCAAKKAEQTDGIFKDDFCRKNWEIAQGQPFLVKRMQLQEENLKNLQQELAQLEEKLPPPCLAKLLAAMQGSNDIDLEELKLEHGDELEQYLLSYISQKGTENRAAMDKLSASHAQTIAKMVAAGESEHKIEKVRVTQSNQLDRYKQKLNDFSHFNLKSLYELYGRLKALQAGSFSMTNGLELNNIAIELTEHVQRQHRSINSKKAHIQQVEHELLGKQCLVLKELVEQMENLNGLAHQLHKETGFVAGHKLMNLLRSLFQSKVVKGRYAQLETGFKKAVELYLLTYDMPKFAASVALHREVMSLAKLISALPFVNESTRELVKTALDKADQGLRRSPVKMVTATTQHWGLMSKAAAPNRDTQAESAGMASTMK